MTQRSQDRYEWVAESFPWEPDQNVKDVLFWNGVIVWSFARIDFIVSKLAIEFSNHDAYVGLRGQYPYKISNRIAYWKELASRPGPLLSYRPAIEKLLHKYKVLSELRHVVAHARMVFVAGVVRYEAVDIGADDPVQKYKTMHFSEIKKHSIRAARFARLCGEVEWRLRQS